MLRPLAGSWRVGHRVGHRVACRRVPRPPVGYEAGRLRPVSGPHRNGPGRLSGLSIEDNPPCRAIRKPAEAGWKESENNRRPAVNDRPKIRLCRPRPVNEPKNPEHPNTQTPKHPASALQFADYLVSFFSGFENDQTSRGRSGLSTAPAQERLFRGGSPSSLWQKADMPRWVQSPGRTTL